MAGDSEQLKRIYGLNVLDVDVPAVNDNVVVAKGPARIIVLVRVWFAPSSYAAATLTLSDSVTGKAVATITVPASAPQVGDGASSDYIEYGANDTALSPGANLVLGVSGTAAGRLHLETVQKGYPSGTGARGFATLG